MRGRAHYVDVTHEGLYVQPLQCCHRRECYEATPKSDSITCAAEPIMWTSRYRGLYVQPCSAVTGRECCEANPSVTPYHAQQSPLCGRHATKVCTSSLCSAVTGGECCEATPKCDSITCAAGAHYVDVTLRRFARPAFAVLPRAVYDVMAIRIVTP